MKILAVIPACEGSVRLPNKNIRVLNGKPLVYYVIDNARRSRYITDVIVTTNSTEIVTIAKHMGAKTKLRDPTPVSYTHLIETRLPWRCTISYPVMCILTALQKTILSKPKKPSFLKRTL